MSLPSAAPTLGVSALKVADVATDLLVVPYWEDESLEDPALRELDRASGNEISRGVQTLEFRGRPYEVFATPIANGCQATRVAVVGCGKQSELSTERLRRVATVAGLHARERRAARLAWVHRGTLEPASAVQAAVEGLVLAAFSSDSYKSGERAPAAPQEMLVVVPEALSSIQRALEVAAERGRILAESSNMARALCNEPSNVLTPSVFASRAVEIGTAAGVAVDVLDECTMADLGMGLLLGVARGSSEPPRLIVLRHEPAEAPAAPVLGLVGKGITFDSGGISIKPADGMDRMKDDMSGGAAVICAMRALALLGAPIRVLGVVPATENMPSGSAVKPGDVLTSPSGKTVEVINTDAEGRLVLADALWYAQRLGATHLVDVATLTGACVVALGKAAAGLFGRPESWVESVRRAALAAGDRCWPMPLYEEYADQLRSEIADMVNSGGRPAGACTAATFIKQFTGDLPWVHLDIAGTAWADEVKPWQPKGATGVAVRTLAELALTSGTWRPASASNTEEVHPSCR